MNKAQIQIQFHTLAKESQKWSSNPTRKNEWSTIIRHSISLTNISMNKIKKRNSLRFANCDFKIQIKNVLFGMIWFWSGDKEMVEIPVITPVSPVHVIPMQRIIFSVKFEAVVWASHCVNFLLSGEFPKNFSFRTSSRLDCAREVERFTWFDRHNLSFWAIFSNIISMGSGKIFSSG